MKLLLISVFVALALPEAGAQLPLSISNPRPERTDTGTQRVCRAAASVLQTVAPEQAPDNAREQITRCEVSGPAAMAHEWSLINSNGSALLSLTEGSRFVRDERIFAALQSAAIDQTRNNDVRIAAMGVLANYAIPASDQLEETSFGPRLPLGSSAVDTIAGDQRVVGDIPGRVIATLQNINDSAVVSFNRRPGPVRRPIAPAPPLPSDPRGDAGDLLPALNKLLLQLRYPVDATNVTLAYVCGNRYRIRNMTTSYVAARIQTFESGKTVDFASLDLQPALGTGDYTETVFDTGVHVTVVIMSIYGEQLAKASGNTVCPP